MATPIDPQSTDDWDEPLLQDPKFTSSHIFSTSDITVTFAGDTIANISNPQDVFDTTGESGTKTTKDGVTLYPIDSEFGFYVSDFENAVSKELDDDYAEGWAGDLTVADEHVGLVLSDSPTDTFKTPALLGTWLSGLGGNTVKASTEHYVVMQNILSDQKYPGDDGDDVLYPLDDELVVIGGEFDGLLVSDAILALEALDEGAGDRNGDGAIDIKDVLAPNETEIDQNIAVSTDYSVTLKDDGKLLYRWGNTIKKPNDIRVEATLDLPDEWSEYNPLTSLRNLYAITDAELVVHHTITNNPNDQVRPEDFENEAAIGTLPSYDIIENYNGETGRTVWVVPEGPDNYNPVLDAYGTFAGDGTFYEAGTILKDSALADSWALSDLAALGATDGAEGFTNAWYTIMDREPFEPVLNEDGTAYEGSGPRWRLQPDKYGQDLPSVVIPDNPSLTANPTKDQVKYEVGAETQTVLNLLDWGLPTSPLSISAGWQDKPGEVSENGVNYTDGFDMAVYIKGDIKPATIYSAELLMDYELITPYADGESISGTDGDDYLVGIGSNIFDGGAGSDLMVLSYGSSLASVDITASTINNFVIGEDTVGFIDLGVNFDTFETLVSQAVVEGSLEIEIDGALVATLTGITQELDMETDFFFANPGPGDEPGGEEPNLIVGTAASETLLGTSGDDIISGLAGNDYIYGLAGEDELNGGAGLDRLYGGADADVFVFEAGTRLDIVYDFADGEDQIQLLGLDEADFGSVSITDYRTSGTLVTVGADRMILQGVDSDLITVDDFVFDDTPDLLFA